MTTLERMNAMTDAEKAVFGFLVDLGHDPDTLAEIIMESRIAHG